jgi:hypothetical protein
MINLTKKVLSLWLLTIVFSPAMAQDDLLSIIEQDVEVDTGRAFATFKTTRIINGQSVELPGPGILNFIIGHRFGKINDGVYHLFGLDQATIRLGLEYGFSERFSVGVGRSSFQKTYDASVKFRPIFQRAGERPFPFSIVLYSGLAINTLRWSQPERANLFSSRVSYFHQVLLARKFSPDFSLQFSPTLIHRNFVATANDQNDVFAMGIGGRYRITNRFTLNGEYFYQLPGENARATYNSVSIGFDIDTGGHVFQLHFTNSQGMVENYFVAETLGDLFRGDIYFGFNINRVFLIRSPR